VDATIGSTNYVDFKEATITSASEGDVVKFTFRVPSGSEATVFDVCAYTSGFRLSTCDVFNQPLPAKGSSPIRVDYAYPS
jgi:hypothetical protein